MHQLSNTLYPCKLITQHSHTVSDIKHSFMQVSILLAFVKDNSFSIQFVYPTFMFPRRLNTVKRTSSWFMSTFNS